jgi:putative acetyltransferase
MFDIREDDLSGEAVRALLALHLAGMRDNSPPGFSFALDLSGLKQPEITVWTIWRGEALAGVAALKEWDGGQAGELKSMRTHPDFLRQGAATIMLDFIIREARARGCRTLSLETGVGEAYEAALALYRGRGFKNGEPFADYAASPHNQFLHLEL